MTGFDFQGAAILIGAVAAAVPIIGGFVLTALTYRRQNRLIAETKALHNSVNGQSDELKKLLQNEAFTAGEAAGQKAERKNPMTPAGKP